MLKITSQTENDNGVTLTLEFKDGVVEKHYFSKAQKEVKPYPKSKDD